MNSVDQMPATPATIDPWLRDKEAASLLKISVATFWRRVTDGTIPPAIKFGGMSRWTRSDILAVKERAEGARHVAA